MTLQTRTESSSPQAGSACALETSRHLETLWRRHRRRTARSRYLPARFRRHPRTVRLRQDDASCASSAASSRRRPARSRSTAATSPASARNSGPTNTVFQGYGLFPHMTVRQNVGYGLRLQKKPKAEIDDRVAEALRLSRLTDFADRSVTALSGGQQQRVALARALILRPESAAPRRTARRARPQASPRDAGRTAAPAPGIRRHVRLRHPRPGRGAVARQPHRGDERRPDRAGRQTPKASMPRRRPASSPPSSATRTCFKANARADEVTLAAGPVLRGCRRSGRARSPRWSGRKR